MLKQKVSLVVVLGVLLTLAVGYALFSQTINITGTATASGSFQFTPVCTIGVDSGISDTASAIITRYNTLMTAASAETIPTAVAGSTSNSCTISGNTVTFATTLQYPGAMSMFTVKITNTGTISGKFNEDANLLNGGSGSTSGNGTLHRMVHQNIALYIEGTNMFPTSLAQVDTLEATIFGYEFEPNDVVYLVYVAYWDPDSNVSCNGGSSCEHTFSFDLPIDQY